MYFAQHYLDCLSQAAYVIGDPATGRAVVVDPRRDVDEYVKDAEDHGFTVEAVINTHFHADFLAGHLELAARTGAWIGYGRRAETEYPIRKLADGERISLGDVTLQILETPGHTPESISIVVYEYPDDAVPYGVLTGDALFVGDVGRPDLLASVGVTAAELAAMLYDSVHHKLLALPEETRVFPAHGAGSSCGKNLSTERSSTIGMQKLTNYACRPMDERTFIALVTEGQSAAPGYFSYDADLNRRNRDLYDAEDASRALDPVEFARLREEGALVLDARDPLEFAAGHLAGAVNVPIDGRFAEQAGSVFAPADEILVIAPDGHEREAVTRLARIGFDRVLGHATDTGQLLRALRSETRQAERLTADALRAELASERPPLVLDVRNCGERADGRYIEGARHIPLAELATRLDEIPAEGRLVLHCAGGHRSSIAASLLRQRGRTEVCDLLGGYAAWAPTA
ncbi:rhodanese-like domain-containing protein [Streptomyces beihaiensis]|uniref:Rhodanese-like domain-containing protein n=1 Tax=Streptomyces beihaiensis TaxID=2984495 RepID=A0ABT3TSM1_9ACTN|nr:rhodanese-like domain-containing protein [Streptomyces beihaiensis]MCX3060044.1 rhodanese-like domain-containing protein [Streptomyces beihaiensis]